MTAEEPFSNEKWQAVFALLTEKLGKNVCDSWISPIMPGTVKDGVLSLYLPTRFLRDYIVRHYADEISDSCRESDAGIDSVTFEIGAGPEDRPSPASENDTAAAEPVSAVRQPGPEMLYSSELDPHYTFENFIVGNPNEFAYAAARRIAESREVAFNPLFLYSSVGMGKTHLMHSIAWYIRTHDPARKVVYMSAEKFQYHFVHSLKMKNTYDFKEQLRSVDVLLIDDVQFLIGKDGTQEEFFHTFNSLTERGSQIVLSADKSPVNLDGIENRLKTRLAAGVVADIHPMTYELRLLILESKARLFGVPVPQEVLEFLAEKLTTSVRELEGALKRVVYNVQLVGGTVTLEQTRFILKDLLNLLERKITVEEIQHKVAAHYNIRFSDLQSKRRERPIARPRQVAMYLAKTLTTASLPEIGRKFDRDHTTVIHAVRTVEELMEKDKVFADDVNALRRAFSFY